MSVFNDVLPPLSGGRINQFGQFEEMLEQVRSLALVSDVPADKESTFDVPSQKIRLQPVSTRLYLLGYLPRKIHPKNIHKKLVYIGRVGGLGSLGVSLSSAPSATADNVDSHNVVNVRPRSRPGKELRDALSNATFEKVV